MIVNSMSIPVKPPQPLKGSKRSTKRMSKVIIPLLVGFKLTGALIFGLTVVKLFLMKAFVVSKLALLAALFMMIRKLLSAVGAQHHPYLFSQHKLPAYSLDAGYPAAAASDYSYGYSATPYHGYYGHYSTAGDYGHYAAAAAAAQEGAAGGGGDDLQGHFSTNSVNVQQAPGSGTRNSTKMVARTDVLISLSFALLCTHALLEGLYSSDGTFSVISVGFLKTYPVSKLTFNGFPKWISNCTADFNETVCLYSNDFRFQVNVSRFCANFITTSKSNVSYDISMLSSFVFNGHLYGGPELKRQLWPAEKLSFSDFAYVTKHEDNAAIAERFWLTSGGRFYFVPAESSFFLSKSSSDTDSMSFKYFHKSPYPSPALYVGSFTICEYGNAKVAHMDAVINYLRKPLSLPDVRLIKAPVWTTWPYLYNNFTQSHIEKMASNLEWYEYYYSFVEIGDKWEDCYGNLTFDSKRFPDVLLMMQTVHKKSSYVSLWVHPFIEVGCDPVYKEASENNYFVKSVDGSVNINWGNTKVGVIDFTNENAKAWYVKRIKNLVYNFGIDHLRFDAGESSLLPQNPILSGGIKRKPNLYTQSYLAAIADFGNTADVSVGFESQQYPFFVRMKRKDSTWGYDNGLRTLVSTLLHMNVVGYSLMMSDVVGGSNLGILQKLPTKELYIRWLQVASLMPSVQFSYPPWEYDKETKDITKKFMGFRKLLAYRMIQAIKNCMYYGTPVNPPLWWIDPDDKTAQFIDDEFLMGEDFLVAPILQEGVFFRDIYLPKGKWRDVFKKDIIDGPVWLKNYSVPLSEIACFDLRLYETYASANLRSPHFAVLAFSMFSVLSAWAYL